ncbi:hypothetical protein Pmani_011582 [Petrolisthes manimaculis]|uniref:Uncharacterized protein n=1 Tax=Petrolisthes manimaculis TaxID=1843537 RepID=A0AAE1PZT7_9EUCA|nr:hypothetical protein Pmani_011582 [Petrolisthes manimaculis]
MKRTSTNMTEKQQLVKGTSTDMTEEQLVGVLVGQIVEKHLPSGCHLVLMSQTMHSPIVPEVIRQVSSGILVTNGTTTTNDQQGRLSNALWGDYKTTCRALILLLGNSYSSNNNTDVMLRDSTSTSRLLLTSSLATLS